MKIEFNAQIIKKGFMKDSDISEYSNNYIIFVIIVRSFRDILLRIYMYMYNFLYEIYYMQY